MVKRILIVILVLIILTIVWIIKDYMTNDKIQAIPARPSKENDLKKILSTGADEFLEAVENGETFDDEKLEAILSYLDNRYDTSDFQLVSLMRIMYKHSDKIPDHQYERIKTSILNYKYWMDQPGNDSMCYWSENHQLLFATAEYLAGILFPNEIFTNDNKTGLEHSMMGRERVITWLEQRYKYGYTEWYSNTYYVEDIGPLANLIDYAKDDEIVTKATIAMDLLLYDLATQSYKGALVSTSGRCYENGKKSGASNSMRTVAMDIWPEYNIGTDRRGMDLNFLLIENYKVPEVIVDIGRDNSNSVIKASTGLNVSELKSRNLIGTNDNQIMMQLAMEAFTNPEIISNTMAYIDKNDMLQNEFVNEFKIINIGFLKTFNLLPFVSRTIRPVTDGVAIQRANTYTYRTDDYMMATAQNYHPGEFADQQHIWTATLGYDFNVFTTHPAKELGEGALGLSPNYWVGSGRLPHSVQSKNVNMTIYNIDDKKGFMEKVIYDYTHAYFPTELFDKHSIEDNIAVGEYNNGYIALIGRNDLVLKEGTTDDLIQNGKLSYWICELGSKKDYNSLEDFKTYIEKNIVTFDENKVNLTYKNSNQNLEVTYKGNFLVDGTVINTDYPRFDSPYSSTEREPEVMKIEFNNKSLLLDFYNGKRVVKN